MVDGNCPGYRGRGAHRADCIGRAICPTTAWRVQCMTRRCTARWLSPAQAMTARMRRFTRLRMRSRCRGGQARRAVLPQQLRGAHRPGRAGCGGAHYRARRLRHCQRHVDGRRCVCGWPVAVLRSLAWAAHPAMSADDVAAQLRATADDCGEPGRDDRCGDGRVNAWRAVAPVQVWLPMEAS